MRASNHLLSFHTTIWVKEEKAEQSREEEVRKKRCCCLFLSLISFLFNLLLSSSVLFPHVSFGFCRFLQETTMAKICLLRSSFAARKFRRAV
jgi:hypothetical protein